MTTRRVSMLFAALLALSGCASMSHDDPPQVTVAGIEGLPGEGEGMEVRMLVKLRVQNPNDAPIQYDGVYLKLDVLDKTFASGVSSEGGPARRQGHLRDERQARRRRVQHPALLRQGRVRPRRTRFAGARRDLTGGVRRPTSLRLRP